MLINTTKVSGYHQRLSGSELVNVVEFRVIFLFNQRNT